MKFLPQFPKAVAPLLLCAASLAWAQAPADAAASAPAADAEAVTPKMAPLLSLVLRQLGTLALQRVGGVEGLFSRLKKHSAPSAVAAPVQVHVTGAGTNRGSEPAVAPVVGYAIEWLDSTTFASRGDLDVSKGPPQLRTGDTFAIRYSTSTPGLVRLDNIDPEGKVNDLGTYLVLPDQANRIPKTAGIRLAGRPGIEVVRFQFFPCLPDVSADDALRTNFGTLPDCARGVPTAAGPAPRAKTLVNLEQPDPTMSFAGTADYRRADTLSTTALIRHEAP